MKRAIVSTSINESPPAYELWAAEGDLIVAGDMNSPPGLAEYVNSLDGVYLDCDEQERYPFSDFIGWNCIQRRNAAVMYAYERGYDVIVTVDDDNSPIGNAWLDEHMSHLGEMVTSCRASDLGWVNIGDFVHPPTMQRGIPYGVGMPEYRDALPPQRCWVRVIQAHILGDPDCDAITRLESGTVQPWIGEWSWAGVVNPGDYAPFNSQATVYEGRWAPFIACLPHIGRYDDIWSSLITQACMRSWNAALRVGAPPVQQERNPHDYVRDLANEVHGLRHMLAFMAALDEVIVPQDRLSDAYYACVSEVSRFLPENTQRFAHEWATYWRKVEW